MGALIKVRRATAPSAACGRAGRTPCGRPRGGARGAPCFDALLQAAAGSPAGLGPPSPFFGMQEGKIREWGLSNETAYGVCQFCESAKRLGVKLPVAIQNDGAPRPAALLRGVACRSTAPPLSPAGAGPRRAAPRRAARPRGGTEQRGCLRLRACD